jgi:hypothetical protein
VPAEKGMFGWIYFGFDVNEPQGGLNDKGLFFGNTTTEPEVVSLSAEKTNYPDDLMMKIMTTCSTVDEALKVFDSYNLTNLFRNQIFVADKTGNSAVIEGNSISRKDTMYQILTNFRYSKAKAAPDYKPCERYVIAKDMLEGFSEVSIDRCRRILAATHQEGMASTIYSYIIDLAKELKKGKRSSEIAALFPKTYAAGSFERWKYWELKQRRERKTVVDVNFERYQDYVGEYEALEIIPGSLVQIIKEDKRLYMQIPGRSKLELLPEADDKFFYISLDGDFNITLISDESGKIVQLLYEEEGVKIPFRKLN